MKIAGVTVVVLGFVVAFTAASKETKQYDHSEHATAAKLAGTQSEDRFAEDHEKAEEVRLAGLQTEEAVVEAKVAAIIETIAEKNHSKNKSATQDVAELAPPVPGKHIEKNWERLSLKELGADLKRFSAETVAMEKASCALYGGIAHEDRKTCCEKSCGAQCGSNDCWKNGMATKCCKGEIPDQLVCNSTRQAPCVLEDPCIAYGGMVHPDGRTCCGPSCGKEYCGATNCWVGGRAKECCWSAIPHEHICGKNQQAPCDMEAPTAEQEPALAPFTHLRSRSDSEAPASSFNFLLLLLPILGGGLGVLGYLAYRMKSSSEEQSCRALCHCESEMVPLVQLITNAECWSVGGESTGSGPSPSPRIGQDESSQNNAPAVGDNDGKAIATAMTAAGSAR